MCQSHDLAFQKRVNINGQLTQGKLFNLTRAQGDASKTFFVQHTGKILNDSQYKMCGEMATLSHY